MADVERMAVRVWTWKTWQRAHEEPDHIDSAVRKQRDGSWYQAHSPPFALSRTPACGTGCSHLMRLLPCHLTHIFLCRHAPGFVSMVTSHPTLTIGVNLHWTSRIRAIAETVIVEDSREIL